MHLDDEVEPGQIVRKTRFAQVRPDIDSGKPPVKRARMTAEHRDRDAFEAEIARDRHHQ
jgi:hypothetical protein